VSPLRTRAAQPKQIASRIDGPSCVPAGAQGGSCCNTLATRWRGTALPGPQYPDRPSIPACSRRSPRVANCFGYRIMPATMADWVDW
jgi:hypothetical protein